MNNSGYSGRAVDIVIVNWNAGRMLAECLASLEADRTSAALVASVTIVDNGSQDNSLEQIGSYGFPVELVGNSQNLGFGRASNQGAKRGTAPFILFLNPDTRFTGGSLPPAVDFLSDAGNSQYGICGVKLLDERGAVSRSCARFPRFGHMVNEISGLAKIVPSCFSSYHMRDWDHAKTADVDHVIGAFYLIRRSLFEALGGFDERFFVYMEDLDLSLRAALAGQRTRYLADVQAFHSGGGVSRRVRDRRLAYSLASRSQFIFKHLSQPAAWILLGMTIFVEPLARLFSALIERSMTRAKETTLGTARFYSWLISGGLRRKGQ